MVPRSAALTLWKEQRTQITRQRIGCQGNSASVSAGRLPCLNGERVEIHKGRLDQPSPSIDAFYNRRVASRAGHSFKFR